MYLDYRLTHFLWLQVFVSLVYYVAHLLHMCIFSRLSWMLASVGYSVGKDPC